MTDRELLELVAKAAGYEVIEHRPNVFHLPSPKGRNYLGPAWDPLADDGDALRLAVKLRIRIAAMGERACAFTGVREFWEPCGVDEFGATRRAIVRAAAAIQQAKEAQ